MHIFTSLLCTGLLAQPSPQFNSSNYDITFNQNLPTGHTIATLLCSFSGVVNYRFLNPGNVNFLTLSETNGGVALNIDALNISTGTFSSFVECFDVSDSTDSTSAFFRVTRIDENEFSPRFLHAAIELSLSEDFPLNTLITIVNATDEDRGNLGVIEYSFESLDPEVFSIFAINSETGEITSQSALDYEQNTVFDFLVRAANTFDQGVGRNLRVTISVEDIDDTAPAFELGTYDVAVHETVLDNIVAGMDYPRPSAGFLVTRCIDPDTPSSQITYSLVGTGSISPLILDEASGSFSVNADLDYETQTSYSFMVTCYDNSESNQSSTVSVDVAILPVNEQVPVIVQRLSTVVISETVTVGVVIATGNSSLAEVSNKFLFTDTDAGADGNITYTLDDSIPGSGDSEAFLLDLVSGDLSFTENLDNDVDGITLIAGLYRRFAVSIVGCDEFPPSDQCNNFDFRIFVLSINEFDPIIAEERYTRMFPESYLTGSVILSASDVSCTDADRGMGELGMDHVEIVTTSSTITDLFHIDTRTGEIQLQGVLDYEVATNYGFEIRCYDNNGREDLAIVTIDIVPENDNFPVFDQRSYFFNVSRTTPANRYVIGRISATDIDVGLGGDITYSLQTNGFVDINTLGELLLFNSVLNITETSVSFTAFVTDSEFTDDVLVVLQITEGNTNRPSFADGTSDSIQLSELVMFGETIADLSCSDPDSGANGEVRFSISEGNTDDAFSIDPITGEITVNRALTLPEGTSTESYTLALRCDDLGVPTFFDDATIFVTVFRDDSNPPMITNTTINIFLSEDTATGTIVATIEAVDIDSDQLNYRLENESSPGFFFIEPTTGDLTLGAPLDREIISEYRMVVVVTENRIVIGPERSDSALVNIFIRDVNDNNPTCTRTLYNADVDETAGVGTLILQLQCNDPDLNENGLLTYTLVEDFNVLSIDSGTGVITLGNLLNNTESTLLPATVIVSDSGILETRQIQIQVTVSIISRNNNQPTFQNLPMTINVSEAQLLGDVFFTVVATDSDRGSFGQIIYSIAGGNENTFSIISNTGGLSLVEKLNFFSQAVYSLNISASDTDFDSYETLTINVLDANEYNPVCESIQESFSLAESIEPNALVFQQLSCSDNDEGSNGQIVYTIESGNIENIFEIQTDGTVATTDVLDYEAVQEYNLDVLVSDGGSPPRSTMVAIRVTVTAVNEFPPVFTQALYEMNVVEHSDISTSVLQAMASDQDLASHRDGEIAFSINGPDARFFTIASSGIIRIASAIDRELTGNSLIFTVTATDQAVISQSSSALINITVVDLDDNSPVFTTDLYVFVVNTTAMTGTQVGSTLCTDIDAPSNARISYSFTEEGEHSSFFDIRQNGGIELIQDVPINSIFTFDIVCTGPSPLNRSDSATVSVRVLLNSTITFHPDSTYDANINENSASGTEILVLNATASTGAILKFNQINLLSQFRVDESGGSVQLTGALDFETTESYSLRVEATDNGDPPNTNEAIVHVTVINLNDREPRITTEPTEIVREEENNIEVETLDQYLCSDGDSGDFGIVSFRIADGDTNNIFSITAPGMLLLVGDLDYEIATHYTLRIVCEDGGNPPLSDEITVPIRILPVNDNPPIFNTVQPITVDENTPIGTNVGLPIAATDQDSPPHNTISYSISPTDSPFSISPTTGQLTLQTSLDFEEASEYMLTIRADNDERITTANLTITVSDVNDNMPVFSRFLYFGTIPESANIGDMVLLVVCTDRDSGANGDIMFTLVGDFPFQIESNGALTVAGTLDHEARSLYRFGITCSDGIFSASADIIVIVVDVDEHMPVFVAHVYNFRVSEDDSINTEIGTVEAIDQDGLIAGVVMYEFPDTDVPFEVNVDSGVLTLTSIIDYEEQQMYTFFVEAFDVANNRDTALVMVEINNVNDNNPSFSDNLYFFSVRESSPQNTPVGMVECMDVDDQTEGIPVQYSLGSQDVPFHIDSTSGMLVVNGVVDFETTARYMILAFCNDSGNIEVSTDITIDLEPFNDFAPSFVEPSSVNASELEVAENLAVGNTLARLIAVDADQGPQDHRAVVFSIIDGNGDNVFVITSSLLRLQLPLDREQVSEYLLVLRAENVISPDDTSNSISLFSIATYRIIVTDINDNSPIISPENPPVITLIESNSSNVDVAVFVCTDADDGLNGLTNFSLSSTSLFDNFIITENGVVRTIARVINSIVLDITCSDRGQPPKSTTVSLAINSVIINEHAPIFSLSSYSFRVLENATLGTIVDCVMATDMDRADTLDGTISYSLILVSPQNNQGSFGIQEDTGCVFVAAPLNFDIVPSYFYQVVATDLSVEPLSSTAQLLVSVDDAVAAPPVFENIPYSSTLFENQESGTFVVELVCSDIDDNDDVLYSILDGNVDGIFVVNMETGVITLSPGMTLDYEMSPTHILTAACTDIHNLQATTFVNVIVSPVNEFTPTFASGPFEIEENAISRSEVIQLQFFDDDNGPDGAVMFEVIGDILDNDFTVTASGQILVNGTLDREEFDFYYFQVRITDQSVDLLNRRMSSHLVNITILDQNDNEPIFASDTYTYGPLNGNETIGNVVGSVSCTDFDLGANAMISYSISDTSDLFDINVNTGNIFVIGDLAARQFDDIILFIECADAGSPIRSDAARVLIEIQEVNRNAPEFLNSSYLVRVPEDTQLLNEVIVTVQAVDLDDGVNGEVRYSLVDSVDTTFFINEDTGDISILRSLDVETRALYVLTVVARDGAIDSNTQLMSEVNVTIEVTGVNEFTPVCFDPIYVTIINRTTIGPIIDFRCTDGDIGMDGALSYTIRSGNDNGLFNVSEDGSFIVTTFISPNPNFEQFVLQISVTDMGMPSLQITIEAILIYSFDNLNTPTFESQSYSFNVSESSMVGTIIGRVVASDSDPGLQGQVVYSVTGVGSFEVDPVSGELFVRRPLDWESTPTHTFTVMAEDSDPLAPLRGVTTVTINVINENDNIPQCESMFYTVEIFSNATIDETVVLLNCEDADQTPIQFELSSGQTSPFRVDPITGRVYIAGPVTPSTVTALDVNVIGNGGEFTQITISIQVIFINTQPPVFAERQFSISIPESTPLLTVIGYISATDPDSHQADLIYFIEDPLPPSELYINPTNGEIILTSPLDFETTAQYSYTVFVMDAGSFDESYQLVDMATLTVNVTNTNDNSPILDSGGVYGVTVMETTSIGASLVNISCTDDDASPFSSPQVSANLTATPFRLVPVEDLYSIEVSQQLSGPSSFIFDILCTDNGNISSEGQVYIFVPEPLAPVFTEPRYDWILSETGETGEQYSNIQASSNDGSAITYSITDGNDNNIFYIEPDTGVIILVISLDFEMQTSHGLVVRAVDGSGRQSSVLLLVTIVDENDEVPLTPPSALLSVRQNAPVGFPIGVLQCTDLDSIANTTFSFDPPNTLFSVDNLGIVRLEGALTDTPVYSLPVLCFDITRPEDVSMGIITIEVEFVNVYPPIFGFDSYIFSIPEDAPPLSFVGQISATDRDVGSFGEIAYMIFDGNPDQFFIDAITGRIGILTSVDRETIDTYVLNIAAIDGGVAALPGTRLNETTLVTIRIADVNDNHPIPQQFTYIQSISTNHTLLSPVLTVTCTDADLLDNGVIDYSLEQDGQNFVIQSNGTVLLAREQTTQAVHNFQVVCTDRGVNRLSSSAQVTVTVDIASLIAPVFDLQEYNISIDEDVAIHTSILQVNAVPSNPDIEVVYSIVGGNEGGVFTVDPLFGNILVIDELDAAFQQEYVLTVRATIAGRASISSLVSVFISVTDLNDNIPQFSSPFYSGNVTEGASISTPIVQLMCTDSDLNTDISYSILYSLNIFNITDEGLIYVNSVIDFEKNTSHAFEVTCTDGGSSPHTVRTSVRINVDPVNEFVPTFSQAIFNFTASENSFGAQIGILEAIDDDAGFHGDVRYFLQDPGNNSVVLINSLTGELIVANNLDYEVQREWDLSVIAVDGGGLESHAIVHIEVLNLNDVIPVMSPIATIATINFDSPMGQPIQSYTCIDGDGSETSLSINSGNSLGLFELNSDNVLVWAGQGNSLDSNAVISLNLLCTDSELSSQRATGHIAIRIQVTDAQPPVFSESVFQRNISENAEVGTVVLTVFATSESMNTSFSFFNLPAGFPFEIDSKTGEVSLTSSLNREAESLYTFFVGASDVVTSGVGVVLVEIRVEDSNDNEPTIFLSQGTITLREDTSINMEFFRLMCTDRDSGINGEITFNITSEHSDTFTVSRINSQIAALSLQRNLDFETQTQYTLEIECRDGGSPSLTDSATLVIVVSGVNEFSPTFSEPGYFFQINETSLPGSLVGTVITSDSDAGEDGVFVYQIEPTQQSSYFTINRIGEIYTTSLPLNSSVTSQLSFFVSAIDTGNNEDTVLVTVQVVDVNTPPILSDFGTYFVTLTTNQTIPEIILEVFCYDIDTTYNADLTLEILNRPEGVAVETITQSGRVTATFTLASFLPAGTYDIFITCSDNGTEALSVTSIATIQVQGANTPPTFHHGSISVSILENAIEGILLTAVNATDTEGNVTYAITGGTGRGAFTIDSQTGEIRLLFALNHELTSNYFLAVNAFDNSIVNPLSARININIDVINVNDEYPVIMPQGIENIVINEDQQLATPIQTYTCVDPDGSSNVRFSFSPDNSPFTLTQNGEIVLHNPVDFEIQDSYTLEITCTDTEIRLGSGVTLSSSVTLIVVVVPVNSHAPVFQPPFELFTPEDTAPGIVIGRLIATDRDLRGQVTFSSDSRTDLFLVESQTGNVVLVGMLDFESVNRQYTLIVEASDNDETFGVTGKTATASITVSVTDINDNSPVCQPFISLQLPTGDYSLTSFAQLSCTDEDSGNNSLLVYTIQAPVQSDDEVFIIENTGELFLRGSFNTPGAVVFTVLVRDSGAVSQSTQTTVALLFQSNVTNAIRFNPSQFNVTISESIDIGTLIFSGVLIRDALVNPTSNEVTFGLELSVDNEGAFVIDPTTGDVTLIDNRNLDYESNKKQFTVILNAIVNAATVNSAILLVSLEDFNDNKPVFSQTVYTAEILENQPAGISLLQVMATDIDSGMNSIIRYSTTSSDFTVDLISGEVTSLVSFDRETNERYSIIVKAMDLGSPRLNSTALITIVILDENDQPPVFRSSLYIIDIDNLTPPIQNILTLEVTDNDANSSLRYELLTTDSEIRDLFVVDVLDGIVRRGSSEFSADHRDRYNFTVEVSDGIFEDTTTVIVYVASVTTDTVVFAENVEGLRYNVREFLILQDFQTSSPSYEIVGGDVFDEFSVLLNGMVLVNDILDRERIPEYVLTIHITDNTTQVNVNVYLTVIVKDANDNTPTFPIDQFTFTLPEGTYQDDHSIGFITATDLDEPGTNAATIEFSIVGSLIGTADEYSIRSQTGELFVKEGSTLDYERFQNITLVVRARDLGEPSAKVNSVIVVLFLTDINDNDPEFVPVDVVEYIVLLGKEDVLSNTRINIIVAILPKNIQSKANRFAFTDPDTSSNVTASLINTSKNNYFRLEQNFAENTAILLSNEKISAAETNDVISLQIALSDEPNEQNPIIRNITVYFTDTVPVTPSIGPLTPTVPFFQSEIGIAVIVVICMLILALLSIFLCMCCYCYLRLRREKDPLRNV